jgi:hypothetical protein
MPAEAVEHYCSPNDAAAVVHYETHMWSSAAITQAPLRTASRWPTAIPFGCEASSISASTSSNTTACRDSGDGWLVEVAAYS